MVVVLGQIGELVVHRELHFIVVVTVLCHGCDCFTVWEKGGRKVGDILVFKTVRVVWCHSSARKCVQGHAELNYFYPYCVKSEILKMYLIVFVVKICFCQSTTFHIWHFSKFFKCLVYESSGEQETFSHTVWLPFLRLSFLRGSSLIFSPLCQLCCICVTVSPPVFPSKRRLLIARLRHLLTCTPPASAGSLQHFTINHFWSRRIPLQNAFKNCWG